jgi:glycine/D-amino acid oxidase-like deaminating enzyme
VALLGPEALRQRYPWLNVDDVALGSLGLSGEGWFDGPALHQAFLKKAMAQGVQRLHDRVVGLDAHRHASERGAAGQWRQLALRPSGQCGGALGWRSGGHGRGAAAH